MISRMSGAAVAVLLIGIGLPLQMTRAQQVGAKPAEVLRGETAGSALSGVTAMSTNGAALGEIVTVAADQPIPNLPGKHLVSLIVDYAPGGSSPPHHHARSAFIYAYVLSGEIRSQVNAEPARIYGAGESWFESPGAHHRVSENASDIHPARLLAIFIVSTADEQLVIPDPQ